MSSRSGPAPGDGTGSDQRERPPEAAAPAHGRRQRRRSPAPGQGAQQNPKRSGSPVARRRAALAAARDNCSPPPSEHPNPGSPLSVDLPAEGRPAPGPEIADSRTIGGVASNTTPPAATVSSGGRKIVHKPAGCALLPVVCDTLRLSSAIVPATWVQRTLQEMDERGARRVAGEDWEIRAGGLKGLPGYRWTVRGTGPLHSLQLALRTDPESATGWRGSLVLGSALLWQWRVEQGLAALDAVRQAWRVLLLGSAPALPQPSSWARRGLVARIPDESIQSVRRVDLAVDHWGPGLAWDVADLQDFASRSRIRGAAVGGDGAGAWERPDGTVFTGPESITLYVGKRGARNVMLRIYRKDVEAAATGKAHFMEPLWQAAGWDGAVPVWRAEIEAGGDWLRAHGGRCVRVLDGIEQQLWQWYTENTRHTVPCATRRRRCDESAVWQMLRHATGVEPADCGWIWQPRAPSRLFDQYQLRRQAAGCLRRVLDSYGGDVAAMLVDVRADVLEDLLPEAAGDGLTGAEIGDLAAS